MMMRVVRRKTRLEELPFGEEFWREHLKDLVELLGQVRDMGAVVCASKRMDSWMYTRFDPCAAWDLDCPRAVKCGEEEDAAGQEEVRP